MQRMENTFICKKRRGSAPNQEEKIDVLLQNQQRLSLAYGSLEEIPYLIIEYIADRVKILDLSHNRFRNLSFLQYFPSVQTLVLDKNYNLDVETFPAMKNLEILWLNNCNLINITEWLQTLQSQCPALKHLSMMCNPVGLTVLNGVSDKDEKIYREQVLKILPSLEYFDGIRITDEQRKRAQRKKLTYARLENNLRKNVKKFIEFSVKLRKNYMTIDGLNSLFLKNKAIKTNTTCP